MPLINNWKIVTINGRARISGNIFGYEPIFGDYPHHVRDGVSFISSPILEMARLPEEDDTVLAMTEDNFYTLGNPE